MYTSRKGITILALYYSLILLGGILIGQLGIRAEIIRSLIGAVLGISAIVLLKENGIARSDLFKDFPFLWMLIFAIYASCLGFFHFYWDVVAHAGGLLVVFYIIYVSVMQLDREGLKKFHVVLNYLIFVYVLINLLFLLVFPEKVLDGGVFSLRADHPFIGLIHAPNSSADVLYVSCLLAFCCLLYLRGSFKKMIAIFAIAVLLFLVFLSESRSAFFAMAFFALSFILYYLIVKNEKMTLWKKAAVLVVVVGLLFYLKLAHLNSSMHLFDDTLKGRPFIWHSVIAYTFTHHHYLFGFGLGRQDAVLQNFTFDSVYTKSHNTFIDIFVGTGLIGLALFLLFWGTIFIKLWKWWVLQKRNALAFFFLIAFITLTVHSFVESYLINQLGPDLFAMILFYALAKRSFQLEE